MRPAVAERDHILDIHSTSQDVVPFWVYPAFERNAAVARRAAAADVHLVMPAGLGSGTPLIQHGAPLPAPTAAGRALVVECGQHFKQATADLAVEVALDFLGHFGLIERDSGRRHAAAALRAAAHARHQHESFAFARPVIGFETFAEGELIATDGAARDSSALCDDCTSSCREKGDRRPAEGVYLTRSEKKIWRLRPPAAADLSP
jgi:hypothetical protein